MGHILGHVEIFKYFGSEGGKLNYSLTSPTPNGHILHHFEKNFIIFFFFENSLTFIFLPIGMFFIRPQTLYTPYPCTPLLNTPVHTPRYTKLHFKVCVTNHAAFQSVTTNQAPFKGVFTRPSTIKTRCLFNPLSIIFSSIFH